MGQGAVPCPAVLSLSSINGTRNRPLSHCDSTTNTLHRFFNDGNGTWHWSGSTNQGVNSLSANEIPIDIKRLFGLQGKGW